MRSRIARAMAAVVLLVAVGSLGVPRASGSLGPTNNFGSRAGAADATGVLLGDSAVQEYSLWPGYMGWSAAQTAFFRGMIYTGVENRFEPSDLTVTQAADNTTQDVRFVPVPVFNADPAVIANALCNVAPGTAIYGAHHHRVCDRHQITIFQAFWTVGLTGDQMVYNVLAHEFGHSVGLRHSESPCADLNLRCVGVSATGATQWNTFTPVPGFTSLMYSFATEPAASNALSLYDYANINLHY